MTDRLLYFLLGVTVGLMVAQLVVDAHLAIMGVPLPTAPLPPDMSRPSRREHKRDVPSSGSV